MSDNNNAENSINVQLNAVVKQLKVRWHCYTVVNFLPWLIVLLTMGFYINIPIILLIIISTLTLILTIWIRIKSSSYQQLTLSNLLQHLNRLYPELQESAQLVTRDDDSLSILQTLQKQKTISNIELLLSDNQGAIYPKISYQNSIVSFVCAMIILLLMYFSHLWLPLLTVSENDAIKVTVSKDKMAETSQTLLLTQHEVLITPPGYTKLQSRQQNDLNVSAVEGSILRWQLAFTNTVDNVFIEFSDNQKLYFTKESQDFYSLEKSADYTSVYRLGILVNGVETLLPEVYTLTIVKDQKAKITIISPKKTITEIATQDHTDVLTQVKITDDYNVAKVEILASIAKGSGESVKFRDQTFNFDSTDVIDGVDHYYINWQLEKLGMEPGDELYFTVKAWDNRQPTPQITRSITKIIRWLEDEDQAVMFDGALLDFMPEYFKSQRQIIIETIELINDKTELTTEQFVEKSELLGIAQRELKEKYGQYLGDEVEDGGGSHAMSHEASEQVSSRVETVTNQDNHDESEEHHHAPEHHHEEAGHHASDDFAMKGFGTDKSGSSEVISQFGHNHEEADIGIMARQDPKALMKRSITNMWQAESHLMLSVPEKALPYEEEALKYLNMAKKAERIYVKRLGFEPPPVTEQRRYQGDLDDILSYRHHQTIDLTDNEKNQLNKFYRLLNRLLSRVNNKVPTSKEMLLSNTERQLVSNVKKQLEALLDKRPVLIKYVAIIERILLANSFTLDNCQLCLPDLAEKIWQLLPEPNAKPQVLRKPYLTTDALTQQYAEFLSVQP